MLANPSDVLGVNKAFEPDEHECMTKEPESMSVGKLNAIVRVLREELYLTKLMNNPIKKDKL